MIVSSLGNAVGVPIFHLWSQKVGVEDESTVYFCLSCFKCPFIALMVGFKYLLTISSITHVHVAKLLFLISLTNVLFTGENRATWRRFTRSSCV